MKYSLYTFSTREEARAWLEEGSFVPLKRPNVPGLWVNLDGEEVQAFENISSVNKWTVQVYDAPDPANFINE